MFFELIVTQYLPIVLVNFCLRALYLLWVTIFIWQYLTFAVLRKFGFGSDTFIQPSNESQVSIASTSASIEADAG